MFQILDYNLFNCFYKENDNKVFKYGEFIDLFFTEDGFGINIKNKTLIRNVLSDAEENFNIILDSNFIISDNGEIDKNHKIYIFNGNGCQNILTVYQNEFIMSQTAIFDDIKQEVIVESVSNSGTFKILEIITDLSNGYNSTDFYSLEEEANISKKEALSLVRKMLDSVLECDFILRNNLTAEVESIFTRLELISKDRFRPIISDGILTLSSRFKNYETDDPSGVFKIVLKETKEIVGEIDFELGKEFKYSGNVSYAIREQFRGNHFATKALGLLVELVSNNESDTDKSLFISTKTDNVASQKVALNNGAVLVYDGDVPKDESLYTVDGIKKVKIYKIDNYPKV